MIEDFFYNTGDLLTYMQSNIPELTIEQKGIYDQIMQKVDNGNALLLLARDFRQTLPVIPRSTPEVEISACLKYSILWQHVKTLKLTTNTRVQLQNDRSADIFSHQLLEIWNRKAPVDLTSGRISLPHNFCNLVMSKEELVEKVFPNIQTNYKNHDWLNERLIERAILAAKNKDIYSCWFLVHFVRLVLLFYRL